LTALHCALQRHRAPALQQQQLREESAERTAVDTTTYALTPDVVVNYFRRYEADVAATLLLI
jgi:hypothetical protein